jgi:hypothetical protein
MIQVICNNYNEELFRSKVSYLVYPYDNTTSSYYNITNGTGYNMRINMVTITIILIMQITSIVTI